MSGESPQLGVRQRTGGGATRKRSKSPAVGNTDDETHAKIAKQKSAGTGPYKQPSEKGYRIALALVTIAAFITRFWKINHPDQVVFDEVHFGKFASYYLQGTYFFDVHPPFGKLLFAFMGWLVGYDGHFLFDNIGDSYIDNKVPYVAFRAMPALLSTLTVPVVYLTMWESGYSLPACLTAAAIVLFDNGQIGQTRLILLDSTLIFSMACSILCYIRFYKQRHNAFGRKWWKWLLLTGVSLSCVISTKYVGVFTFVTIGAAVAIDLWNMLDYRRGLSLQQFGMHFAARAFGLIVVPFVFYLFWFQCHFTVLYRSGPGDDFMTPEFQETLADNAMSEKSMEVFYNDKVTLRHKDTKAYLHSHPDKYPLRYDDGRISSQGQQVTGYPFNDTNNHWIIVPSRPFPDSMQRPVNNNDAVKLLHVATNTFLLSHDVASPYYPTNQEFTTISKEDADGPRYNDTLFEVRIEGKKKQGLRTMSSLFKFVHRPSKVAMWTHSKPLPEWGYKQQEVNGNKNLQQKSNIWFMESIIDMNPEDGRLSKEPKKVKTLPFFKKYFELQRAMFHHNNALTSSHPYASQPIQWPFLMRGVSFWTKNDTREQIYFLGNIVGWWIASSILAVFAGIVGADQLTQRRGIDALDSRTRSRLYNSTGFFWLAWAAHYFPFFLMGRQLFLHHYLPAHLASALVTGALVEFVFGADAPEEGVVTEQEGKRGRKWVPRACSESTLGSWIACATITGIVVASFVFYAPLTYGSPGLNVEEVLRRKWLGYDLHFAK
ncbi:Dolichyl-phosphate-mannose-protein mannosyltransferase-domain-containing protein [Tirmania nivea]|nr:Dolichyl-phosphate-mannose-protein mannosyltransferase-domain-containing protein [Tirmania nivea]